MELNNEHKLTIYIIMGILFLVVLYCINKFKNNKIKEDLKCGIHNITINPQSPCPLCNNFEESFQNKQPTKRKSTTKKVEKQKNGKEKSKKLAKRNYSNYVHKTYLHPDTQIENFASDQKHLHSCSYC
jgi:uncharacterized protein YpiB (UPF0302 family)